MKKKIPFTSYSVQLGIFHTLEKFKAHFKFNYLCISIDIIFKLLYQNNNHQ